MNGRIKRLNALIYIIVLVCVAPFVLKAQATDTTDLFSEPDSAVQLTYSAYVLSLIDSLEAARINEANMRMELEHLRYTMVSADSLKREEQKHRIDSLRKYTVGVPVVVEGDTLFYFYSKRGGYTPHQRAIMAREAMEKLGGRFNLQPDSVFIDDSDNVSDIMYDNVVIASFTDQDALWAGMSQDTLAKERRKVIVAQLYKLKEEHGLWTLLKRIFYFILVVVGQYFLFRFTAWLFGKLRDYIEGLKETKLHPIMIQNYELLDTQKQVNLLQFLANIGRYLVMGLQLLISVPLIFSIFPQTEDLAYQLLGYIWSPIRSILVGIVEYIPNLITIFIICLAIRYLIRLLRYLSKEIESERLKINGFYPDWAAPTFNIIRFLLYAFMIAMIYPYLPGADKGVFQGISVFVGLIISLGSSTVIGNVISGWVITYMRPFRKGDRIKLNDTVGDIIEKTPLVTRIRTSKNEVVTMPNSFIMSAQSINYTTSAHEYGLILHSEVSIGYDVPWRTVHKLLIDAALSTPGILHEPKPFVLETSLSDWYPVYQINAYTRDAQLMGPIYSALHQNIQDRFNEAGVEILSPQYVATRDGNASTVVTDPKKD
ncbi:MAG: mechanosensitive ion channel [Muribaculaceae bacterium]|nr:mechanosensitive ion channel [Muribaculaceae bacterium]